MPNPAQVRHKARPETAAVPVQRGVRPSPSGRRAAEDITRVARHLFGGQRRSRRGTAAARHNQAYLRAAGVS